MNYSQAAFLRLMEAVEDEGGTHLDEVCEDRVYQIPMSRGGEPKSFRSQRCGASAKFEVPYKAERQADVTELALLTVCAVDDSMGAWPRYQDKVGWEGVTT